MVSDIRISTVLTEEVLRVEGRLQKSNVKFASKYPIVLPRKHQMTEFIIKHHHAVEGHANENHLLNNAANIFDSKWRGHEEANNSWFLL